MERALTKFKSGRGRIAIIMMVCLAAVLALPVMAHAATLVSQFPATNAVLHTDPGFVQVDLFSSTPVKSATITIGSNVYTPTIFQSASNGTWAYSEILDSNGVFHPHWAYNSGSSAAVVSLYAIVSTPATATYSVTVAALDNNGAPISIVSPSWSYTVNGNVVYTAPNPQALTNNCTVCHFAGNAAIAASGFAVDYSTDQAMGPDCLTCHVGGFTPKHDSIATYFNSTTVPASVHTNVDWSTSSACASCHGKTFYGVATRNTQGTTSTADDTFVVPSVTPGTNQVAEHQGCSCHSYFDVDANKACANCHTGTYGAAHGWAIVPGAFNGQPAYTASGHNTPTYGTVGAHEKWDGSEGVVVKDSTNTTITQEWPLPTTSVFWSQSKGLSLSGAADGSYSLNPTDSPAVAMAAKGLTTAAINQTVGWGSVITCNDCHSGLAPAGPNGTVAINAGIDPNFPDDWTKAEITSWDPTGMRSIATTMGTGNPYYKQVNTSISGGAFPTVSSPDPAVATIVATAPVGAFMVPVTTGANIAAIGPSSPASKTVFYAVYDGSAQADSRAVMSTSYSRGATPGSKFICQKCHKLANSYQGIIIEGNGRGGRDNNLNYMGMSNEAHMEHHNDLINGQGNCASCHIAIPHGWKRPRLLVYETDPAPYKTQQFFTDSTAKAFYATGALVNSPAQDTSNGNWGYFGPVQPSYLGQAVANPNSTLYKQIGTAIPNGSVGATSNGVWTAVNGLDTGGKTQVVDNTGRTFSSHLEKLSASPLALKELENGPDLAAWTSNDTTNSTSWGKWYTGTGGTGWVADASLNALYTDEAAQNNCTACSSAGLTHVDTGGSGEGVADHGIPGRQANDGTGLHNGNLNQGGGGTWTAVPYWK